MMDFGRRHGNGWGGGVTLDYRQGSCAGKWERFELAWNVDGLDEQLSINKSDAIHDFSDELVAEAFKPQPRTEPESFLRAMSKL